MIRTKFLEVEYGFSNFQEIDELINAFIQENEPIEVIDIKFQSNVAAVADSGVSATSALIIYKVPSESNISSINSNGLGFLINCEKCGSLSIIKAKDVDQKVCYECKGEQND